MNIEKLAKEINASVSDTSTLIINFIFYITEQNILTNFKKLSKNEKSIIIQEYVAKHINQLEEFESLYMSGQLEEFESLFIK